MPEPAWSYDDERARLFARGRFPAHQGVVVRTEALRDQGGFDLSFAVVADYLSILRLAPRSGRSSSTSRWRSSPSGACPASGGARRCGSSTGPDGWSSRPPGLAAALERADTARARVAAEAYRGLWAPGRPLSGLVARIRPTPGR